MDNIIFSQGRASITIPANESIAVSGSGSVNVYRLIGYPNYPDTLSLLGTVTNGQTVYGPYTSGATIIVEAGASAAYYQVGVAPVVFRNYQSQFQAAPVALNATGTITEASILGGILTSTTAAAVAGTLPTGAVMELAAEWAVGDSVDWSIINTGGNTFTLTAATGHTIVGTATVVTVVSAQFRTRKTATDTFITYRLS
jgi:hypothetical protein